MKKFIVSLLGTLVVFIAIVWTSKTTMTGEIVKIKEINNEKVTIENLNGRVAAIEAPKTILNLIAVDKQYYFEYKKYRWRGPKLTNIQPIGN
ncbi:hypothetical protein ACFPVX_18130 [Cohnella faecalis]|uniref:DUF3221 domain-containing protein n=1 Tax=Cohnella faecalis TaxID=2315694 RepID=A0A398CDL6_9BACL|nr:hypothetical protein [Cohnella faecalis]RIE01276.1 hypothetical protein D3H35_23090 [Cohnella faecalis]